MKQKKNRWVGVSPKAKRRYIKARHNLSFDGWCLAVQTRLNIVKAQRDKKSIKKTSIPKNLSNLPIIPNQNFKVAKYGIFKRIGIWFKELFTPAKQLKTN